MISENDRKKALKKRYEIPFPVLYDTKVYASNIIKNFISQKRIEKLMNYKKGYYDYDKNKFVIPKKDFSIIEKNPKYSYNYEIINLVGYDLI